MLECQGHSVLAEHLKRWRVAQKSTMKKYLVYVNTTVQECMWCSPLRRQPRPLPEGLTQGWVFQALEFLLTCLHVWQFTRHVAKEARNLKRHFHINTDHLNYYFKCTFIHVTCQNTHLNKILVWNIAYIIYAVHSLETSIHNVTVLVIQKEIIFNTSSITKKHKFINATKHFANLDLQTTLGRDPNLGDGERVPANVNITLWG